VPTHDTLANLLPAADHIGRPIGTALAFPKVSNTVPPTGLWSQEISSMGSNDFRSTKRNVYWAAVHYPEGAGVVVESNGHPPPRSSPPIQSASSDAFFSPLLRNTSASLDPIRRQPRVE
jgi:hypothetical protein